MKKTFLLLNIFLILNTSCSDLLEVDPRDRYSNEVVWKTINNLDLYVNSLYSESIYLFSELRGVNLTDGYADILKYSQTYMDTHHNRMALMPDYMSAQNVDFLSAWGTVYNSIKKINEFIVDANKYSVNLNAEEVKVRIAEARFLRAFLYHKLIIRHGGVILRVNNEMLDGPEDKNKKRETTSDSWNWVITELNDIAEQLPESWPNTGTGRITKGATYGLIARSALYAEKWEQAIAAAKKVEALADEHQVYGLLNNYESVFQQAHNREIILGAYYKRPDLTNQFDRYFSPTGDIEPYGGYASPTEELVSKFDINIDGSWQTFDWNNPIHANNPYVNRDPRFYGTVLYNGATWKGRTLETFKGGRDGYLDYFFGNNQAETVTGYFVRKFLENKVKDFVQEKGDQYWVEMRYAEILTILSEAYARNSNFSQAYRYLNKVRTRAGMPDVSMKNNWESYLVDLQKEKMCEFAFEGHRYWDIRRWKVASSILHGKRMHGVEITKDEENGSLTYTVVDCDKADRYFPEKYLVVPIPSFEIRNNTLAEQDDIWK